MKKRKTYIVMAVLIAAVVLGVGYAAITSISLEINGTATATTSDENFKVKFTNAIAACEVEDATATATVDNDNPLLATLNVAGLHTTDQTATFTYTILNESPELTAKLDVGTIANSNTEYFDVATDWTTRNVAATQTTTIVVTVTLKKTPIADDISTTIRIPITATPVTA